MFIKVRKKEKGKRKMHHPKRTLAIALIALSIMAIALPATMAANIGEGLWIGDNTYVNARSGRGTTFSIVATTADSIIPYQECADYGRFRTGQ